MSFALKRTFPKIYNFLKKYEKYIPFPIYLWDQKKYILNLRIVSMLRLWKSWPRLKKEAEVVFEAYKSGDFIDVGASHGVYSFLLAPKAKTQDTFVLCEPDPKVKKELTDNLNVLKKLFKNISFYFTPEPIGDGNSVVKNPTIYGHPVYSSKKNEINTLKNKKEIYTSVRIDSLVKKLELKPTFVKIDVEGAEFSILQGMSDTLKNYKPLLMLEKHPTLIPKNIVINDIDNFLDKNGYKVEYAIFRDDITITELWKNYT